MQPWKKGNLEIAKNSKNVNATAPSHQHRKHWKLLQNRRNFTLYFSQLLKLSCQYIFCYLLLKLLMQNQAQT